MGCAGSRRFKMAMTRVSKKAPGKRAKSGIGKRSAETPAQRPQPAGARERNKLDKRDRIRDAAWTLFAHKGFQQTTTTEVAEKAGVAKGTLFLYARDKDDLLLLVMHDRLAAATDEGFATMPGKGPLLAQLLHVFGTLYAMYAAQPAALGASFVGILPLARGPNADRVNALTQAFLTRVSSLVRDAQGRGEVAAEVVPMLAAGNFFASYFMSLMAWIAGMAPSIEMSLAQLEASLLLQMRGLQPEKKS